MLGRRGEYLHQVAAASFCVRPPHSTTHSVPHSIFALYITCCLLISTNFWCLVPIISFKEEKIVFWTHFFSFINILGVIRCHSDRSMRCWCLKIQKEVYIYSSFFKKVESLWLEQFLFTRKVDFKFFMSAHKEWRLFGS